MKAGELYIEMQLRDRQFKRKLNNTVQSLGRFENTATNINQSLELMTKGFRALNATIGQTAMSFIDSAEMAKSYENRLKIMLGSQAKANKLFQQVANYAQQSSSEFKDLMEAATNLTGVLKNPNKEMGFWLKYIDDLAATTGLSVKEVTSQVIRMYTSGAQSAEMFKERGINQMLGFQTGVSYTAEQTRKMLVDAFEHVEGASKLSIDTIKGQLGMLQDKLFKFQTTIMHQGGLYNYFVDVLKVVNEQIKETMSTDNIEDFGKALNQIVETSVSLFLESLNVGNKVIWGWQMNIQGFQSIFYTFAKNFWKVLNKLRNMTISLVETLNVGGIFNDYLKNAKRIEREQKLIINQYDNMQAESNKKLNETVKNYRLINEQIQSIKDQVKNIEIEVDYKTNQPGGDATITKPNYDDKPGKVKNPLSLDNIPELQEPLKLNPDLQLYKPEIIGNQTKEKFEKDLSDMQELAKKYSGEISGAFQNMGYALANSLEEFATKGKLNLNQLASDLLRELQMYAAQRTAHLLMESAYQGVMAIVDPYSGHSAKAAEALQGASIMGSFVTGSGLAGMAHDGMTEIPDKGTWLLDKGERVVDSKTNEDLKKYLKGSQNKQPINIVNNFHNSDEEGVKEALPKLKQTIIDVINSDISTNGSTRKTIMTYAR